MAEQNASTIVFDGDSTGAVAALTAVDVAAKRAAASLQGTGAAIEGVGDGANIDKTTAKVKSLREAILRTGDAVLAEADAYAQVDKAVQKIAQKKLKVELFSDQLEYVKTAEAYAAQVLRNQREVAASESRQIAENMQWNALKLQKVNEVKAMEMAAIKAAAEAEKQAFSSAQATAAFKVQSLNEQLKGIKAVAAETEKIAQSQRSASTAFNVQSLNDQIKASKAAELQRIKEVQAAELAAVKEVEAATRATTAFKVQSLNEQLKGIKTLAAETEKVAAAERSATTNLKLQGLNDQIKASKAAELQRIKEVQAAELAAVNEVSAAKDRAAKKEDAALSSYLTRVKNSAVELQATGRTPSERAAIYGKEFGLPAAEVAKQVTYLKGLEDQLAKTGGKYNEMGMTAKGTAAALRQVPAQFTDIIVSLQGGQAPLTVLLQQGGQLKDVFGGVGNAAKALGGYILGLVNPFTVVAGAAATLAVAYFQGAKEAEAYNKALITTGNAAGVTSGQLGDMAKAVAQATGGSIGSAAEALSALAGSTGIASAQFEKITAVATQMEKVTGAAVADTVKQFSELGKDPVGASLKLTETTRYLTAEVYNQIKALTDQGKTLEAATLAQNTYATAMSSRMPELKDNLGLVQKAWLGITGAAKGAWDAMLNVGREVDPTTKTISALENARAKLADLEKLGNGKNTLIEKANVENLIRALEQKQVVLDGELRTKEMLAGLQKDGVQRDEASIRLAQARDKFAGKEVLMQRELAQARAEYERSNKSADDLKNLDGALAGIKKKYEETAKAVKTVREEVNKAAKEDIAAFKDMEALRQKALGDEMKRAEESLAAAEKTWAAYQKADEAASVRAIESAIAAETELTNYGLLKSSVQELELVRLQSARDSAVANLEDVEGIEKRIEAQKRLIAATRGLEIRTASDKAAKDAEAEWKKTSDSINSTLTDALMRGFESGKDFARNLRDTVVNMFKTMVLRPIISAVMSPISGAITGAMGLSGAASAATGVAGGAATGLAGTLAGFAATAASWGTAAGAGFMATLGGSTIAGGGAAGILATGGAAGASTAGSIGAAAPYALAAVAALAAFGAFRTTKKVGEGITGTLGGDNQSLNSFNEMRKSGYLFGGPKYWDELKAMDPLMAKALKTDFANIKLAATGAADALGLASTEVAGFNKAFRLEFTGDKAKDEALYAELMAGTADDLAKTILGSYKEAITTVTEEIASGAFWDSGESLTSTVTRQVTTSSYTPSEFAKEGETASQTLARLATAITLVNGTSDMLGNKLTEVGLKGANTASLLIDAFGGAERYAAQMGSYYQNFYTQEEQRAKLIENTSEAFTALGKTMPVLDGGARAAYRSMVEFAAGQDMSVESNRAAYASLLSLQGAMNELAPAFVDAEAAAAALAESSKAAAAALAESSKAAAAALAKTNQGWRDQLAILTGSETSRSIALRDATDESTAALMRQVYAQEDVKTAADAATATADTLSKTNQSWQDQLDVLSGRMTARSIALRDATDESTRALMRQVYAQEDIKTAADAAAQAYQAAADAADAASDALAKTNQGWRDQLDVLIGTQTAQSIALRDATDESTRALMRQVYAQQDLKTAVDDATAKSDTALDGIQKDLDAQKTAQTKAVDGVKAVFDTITQAIKDLYSEVSTTSAMQIAEASAFIATSVALAKAGGTLPDQQKLSEAIGTVRSGIGGNEFASQFETDFAKLVLAGQLQQLQDAASPKITDAQAQLAATNDAYEVAKTQLDTLRGIDSSVLSVAEAIEAFQVALTGEQTARQALESAKNPAQQGRSYDDPAWMADNALSTIYWNSGQIASLQAMIAQGGNLSWQADELAALQDYNGNQSNITLAQSSTIFAAGLAEITAAMQANTGATYAAIAAGSTNTMRAASVISAAAAAAMPAYAKGTNYVPEDGPAYLHKGEAVVPAMYNQPSSGSGNARLESLVEGLTKEVQRLQSIANDGNKSNERIATAVNGNPDRPVLVEIA